MKRKFTRVAALITSAFIMASLAGCSSADEKDAVSVESVSSITGIGSVGLADRFGGVIVSGNTQDIMRDESMKLDEILVEVGQEVKAGDVLFTYDNAALLLSLEQQKLEIESMKNSVTANNEQIEVLERERQNVSESEKIRYTLEIQSLQATIRETEYSVTLKEKELARQEAMANDSSVKSEIDGRVSAVNKEGGYDNYGNPKPFVSVMETSNLRVKGILNETNRASLYEGQALTIMSRTDDSVWSGTLSYIDWSAPAEDNSNMYYYSPAGGEMTSSSNYNFYVSLDSFDGLFIGQHVYIDTGIEADDDAKAALMLPSYYICDVDSKPYVWAASSKDKLEKRSVTLGVYSPETDTYAIEGGLSADDYIAFPDDSFTEGAPTVKFEGYSDEPMDGGAASGAMPAPMPVAEDAVMYEMAEFAVE